MQDAAAASGPEQRRPGFWGRAAYELFLESEGLPVHTGLQVADLRTAEPAAWRVLTPEARTSGCRAPRTPTTPTSSKSRRPASPSTART